MPGARVDPRRRRKFRLALLLPLGFSALVLACGGQVEDSPATGNAGAGGAGGARPGGAGAGGLASCGFTPCGGDLVGNWSADSWCGDLTTALQFVAPVGCEDMIQSVNPRDFVQTIRFGSDGTFYDRSSGAVDVNLLLDQTCFEAMMGGQPVTVNAAWCDGYTTALLALPNTTASCTYSNGACACQYTSMTGYSESGTYAVAGTVVTIIIGGSSSSAPFCVEGNTLRIQALAGVVTILHRPNP